MVNLNLVRALVILSVCAMDSVEVGASSTKAPTSSTKSPDYLRLASFSSSKAPSSTKAPASTKSPSLVLDTEVITSSSPSISPGKGKGKTAKGSTKITKSPAKGKGQKSKKATNPPSKSKKGGKGTSTIEEGETVTSVLRTSSGDIIYLAVPSIICSILVLFLLA